MTENQVRCMHDCAWIDFTSTSYQMSAARNSIRDLMSGSRLHISVVYTSRVPRAGDFFLPPVLILGCSQEESSEEFR